MLPAFQNIDTNSFSVSISLLHFFCSTITGLLQLFAVKRVPNAFQATMNI